MKKILKKTFTVIIITLVSVIASLYLSHYIPTGKLSAGSEMIFLKDNGVHIDIILQEDNEYVAYGWGSKVFLTEVPEWEDLTAVRAIQALFTKPSPAMRVTRYNKLETYWDLTPIKLTKDQLCTVQKAIYNSFETNGNMRIHIKDDLYEAKGSYWAGFTCNSWVSTILQAAGLKAPMYTVTNNAITRLYK